MVPFEGFWVPFILRQAFYYFAIFLKSGETLTIIIISGISLIKMLQKVPKLPKTIPFHDLMDPKSELFDSPIMIFGPKNGYIGLTLKGEVFYFGIMLESMYLWVGYTMVYLVMLEVFPCSSNS